MYQPAAIDRRSRKSDVEILGQAMAIVSASGVEALTVRALADRCAMSPSLISYRFGSKQGLVNALVDHVDERLAGLWADRCAGLPAEALDHGALGSLALGILVDNRISHWDLMRTAWALQVGALRETDTLFRPPRSAMSTAYWEHVLTLARLSPELADGLATTLESVGHTLLVGAHSPELTAWCGDVLALQFARLSDGQLFKPRESLARLKYAPAELKHSPALPAPKTPATIIETTKAIIRSDGYRAVSHREIARRSGVSLSSTTHHFASLDDILMSAYWSLYAEATNAVRAVQSSDDPYPIGVYIDQVLPAMTQTAQSSGLNHTVIEEILLLSAQRKEMRQMGLALFASMGETTHTMLGDGKDFDRLDAHLLRHALRGAALQLAQSQNHAIGEEMSRYLKHVFDPVRGEGKG
ncbi:MAG: TetR family transcriptional regulator [Pseudomonadota bacterium]